MKKLYCKSELSFALAWIVIYCVSASVSDNISAGIGVEKIITAPVLLMLCCVLFVFIKKNNLSGKYGLCKPQVPAVRMLFYLPLFALLTVNLWHGFCVNASVVETALYILSMLCVGFLEEVIFRGLLFCAMAENDIKSAVIVSSITFGMGHIINLINGSGASLTENLLQVIYAIAVGFLFVIIFYTTKSLIPCIATHGVFNSLSIFSNETAITDNANILSCLFMVLVSLCYSVYILSLLKTKNIRFK